MTTPKPSQPRAPRSLFLTAAILLAVPCGVAATIGALIWIHLAGMPPAMARAMVVENLRQTAKDLSTYGFMVAHNHEEDREGLRMRTAHAAHALTALRVGGEMAGRRLDPLPSPVLPELDRAQAMFDQLRPDLEIVAANPVASPAFAPAYERVRLAAPGFEARMADVSAHLATVREQERQQLYATVAALGALNVLVFVTGLFYARRRLVLPLRRIEQATRMVGAADFDVLVQVEGDAEIASLAQRFNEMSAALSLYTGTIETRRRHIEAVLESLPQGVTILDENLNLVMANRAFLELIGRPYESVRGRALQDILPLEHNAHAAGTIDGPLDMPRADRIVLRTEDGQRRLLAMSGAPLLWKDELAGLASLNGVVVVFEDRTREDTLDEQARSLEKSYRDLIERSPDAVVIHRQGTIVHVNPAWLVLLGYEASDLVGHNLEDLVAPDDRHALRKHLGERWSASASTFEIALRHRDGSRRCWELAQIDVSFEGGPASAAIGRDIVERKKLASRVMELDRMAAVGTLAAGVGHEINNPLAYVIGNIEHVLRELSSSVHRPIPQTAPRRHASGVSQSVVDTAQPPSDVEQALHEAREGALRVRDIVSNLRMLAPQQPTEFNAVDLPTVVRSSVNLMANEIRPRAILELAIDDPLPSALGNEAKIGQLVIELLRNALAAVSTIRPERHAGQHRIRVALRSQGPLLCLEVDDTGVGIAAAIRPRIFDPFFTTKPIGTGTGLGLAIVRQTVEAHGGDIQLESIEGKGTRVTVHLPVAAEVRASLAPASAQGSGVCPRRARVLVIDDEPLIGRSLERTLGQEHDVYAVHDARAALKMLHEGELFDLILCDLFMHDMSGMALYEAVYAFDPDTASGIVFISGNSYAPEAREFLRSVPNLCLDKPFHLRALEELLRQRLVRRQDIGLLH